MAYGEVIPPENHVIRHIKPKFVLESHDGIAFGAFLARKQDGANLSCFWQELLCENLAGALDAVRASPKLKMTTSARLARLNVGKTCSHVNSDDRHGCKISALHAPHESDESDPHSTISGVPTIEDQDPYGNIAARLIVECLCDLHPAKLT